MTDTSPVQGSDTGGGPSPFGTASVVDLLKQEQREIEESKETFIPVQGYDRLGLRIKYTLPERGKEIDSIANKVRREYKDSYDRNLFTAIDTMIFLCQGLYVQPEGTDEPVMLDPNETGTPLGFDPELGVLLGLDAEARTRARNVVRKLFGGPPHDAQLLSHAERLNRWLQDSKADVSKDLFRVMLEGEG